MHLQTELEVIEAAEQMNHQQDQVVHQVDPMHVETEATEGVGLTVPGRIARVEQIEPEDRDQEQSEMLLGLIEIDLTIATLMLQTDLGFNTAED